MVTKDEILKALERENLKELGIEATLRDITKNIELDPNGNLVIHMLLPKRGIEDILKIKLTHALGDFEDLKSVKVKFYSPQPSGGPQNPPQIPTVGPGLPPKRRIAGVKRVILVGS